MSSTFTIPAADEPLVCVICRLPAEASAVTAVSLRADGSQTFACTAHLRDRRRWIVFWSVFDAEQRRLRQSQPGYAEARQ